MHKLGECGLLVITITCGVQVGDFLARAPLAAIVGAFAIVAVILAGCWYAQRRMEAQDRRARRRQGTIRQLMPE